MSRVLAVTPARPPRIAFIAIGLAMALIASGAIVRVLPVRASDAAPLKAVFIVGPTGSQTAGNLDDAEELADIADAAGMDVRRVYFPHATWDAVMANVQGANLVYYAGHGYGWPSPYTKEMTESRQNGLGLNAFDGSGPNEYKYYGANPIRYNWVLAPNAIVLLNHGCYTAGNGEPGTPIPTWDVARQRVDNFANGFLAAGASAVYAYPYGSFNVTLNQLLTTNSTVEEIFRIPGYKASPGYGWVGWDPRKFDSQRTPGAKNFLDPHSTQGFARAVTGDLSMTAGEWRGGAGTNAAPPVLSDFSAAQPVHAFAQPETPFFTPNGDSVTDTLDLKFTVDSEAFVDMSVKNATANVVRTFSTWTPGGADRVTWDGKNNAGNKVADGRYTITATPRNRAGATGDSESVDVDVFTTMSSPAASPQMFYPSDGDAFAATTTLSVTLGAQATFWWKIADADGDVVKTYVNGANTPAGNQTWRWDGRNNNGDMVAGGTYFSVTTVSTAAGTYFHSVPVDVKAFRLTTKVAPPFVRGGKTKVFVQSAEPLSVKPKIKASLPGLAVKTYWTTSMGGGTWYAVVNFPLTAQPGTMTLKVVGTDKGGQVQQTSYSFQLQ